MKRLFYTLLIFSCLFCILLTGCNLIISLFDGMEGYELKIDPENTQVNLGDSIYYHLNKVDYSTGEGKDISNEAAWVSSDRSIAAISTSGYVETYKVGSVTITAHYEDESASTDLTILPEPEPTPLAGLIAHYEFNGNCDDSSGNEMHAVEPIKDKIEYISGISFSAAYFNGIDAYAITPIEWKSRLSFTICVWVNIETFSGEAKTIMGNCSGVDATIWRGFIINLEETSGNHRFYNVSDVIYEPGFEIGSWHHIVYSYDDYNELLTLYIDGEEKSTQNMIYSNYSEASVNYIGAIGPYFTTTYPFQGAMDEMMIYDWALTSQDVDYLYNSQAP